MRPENMEIGTWTLCIWVKNICWYVGVLPLHKPCPVIHTEASTCMYSACIYIVLCNKSAIWSLNLLQYSLKQEMTSNCVGAHSQTFLSEIQLKQRVHQQKRSDCHYWVSLLALWFLCTCSYYKLQYVLAFTPIQWLSFVTTIALKVTYSNCK